MRRPADLILLNRPDCHLCEEAETILRQLKVHYTTVDVDSDASLAQRWGDLIPVLLEDGREIARAPITADALARTLALDEVSGS